MNGLKRRHASLIIRLIASVAACSIPAQLLAQVTGEVRGRVIDAGTARPVTGGRVELSGRPETATTGADGTYVLRGIEPRHYALTVRAVGYVSTTREIEIENGRGNQVDIALLPVITRLLDVAVTASRDSQMLGAVVFDRASIEQSGRRDVGELLQMTPGVVVTRTGGTGQASSISIRGSSASQVLVLIDGVPLNSSTSGSADLSRVSLESVNRVTVLPGAQSARYGPRAMAGVVDIETRRPKSELSALGRSGAFGERDIALSLGSSASAAQYTISANATGDYRASRGDIPYDVPAVRGGGRAIRINSDVEAGQALGALSLEGPFGNASFRGTWQEMDRGLAGSIVQQSATGRQGNRRWNMGATAQGRLRAIAWSTAADFTSERSTYRDAAPPFGDAFDDTVRASGITASGNATYQAGSIAVAAGAEGRTLDVESSMLSANAPRQQRLAGAWVNTRYSRALNSTWSVDGEVGARADRSSLLDETSFSPRAAVRIVRANVSGSLSLASGFAPPTLADQFFHEGVQVRANSNLRPERTKHDLQARISVRDVRLSRLFISADAAAYRADIDGMILWMPDFRFIWSPSNYNVHRAGWEIGATARAPQARLELQGNLNRSDVTYTGGVINGQVAYRPRNSANISLVFAPRVARVELTQRYIGTRRVAAGSALNALAPYWMTDLGVSSRRTQGEWVFESRIGVENLLNRSAAMLVDYPFPPRSWSLSLRVRRSKSHSS